MDLATRQINPVKRRWWHAGYLAAYLLCALTLALLQPHSDPQTLLNPPDEPFRYMVPTYVANHLRLPSGLDPEVQLPVYGGSYALTPTLAYILMGLVMRLVRALGGGEAALLLAARLVNVCLGLMMAEIAWRIGELAFRRSYNSIFFACALTYFPEALFLHSYVNTESMTMLSLAIMLHAHLLMRKDGVSRRNSMYFALGAILCTLSYYNAYGFLLVSIPLFISACMRTARKRPGVKKPYVAGLALMLRYGGLIVGLWCVGAAWWFVRNAILLDGDILGMATMRRLQDAMPIAVRTPFRDMGSFPQMLCDMAPGSMASFIACYGSRRLWAGLWYYAAYALYLCAGLVATIVVCIRGCRTVSGIPGKREGKDEARDAHDALFGWMMVLGSAITLGLWLYYSYCSDYQPQGRYFLPVLPPLMHATAKGYEALPLPPRCRALLPLLPLLLLLLYLTLYALPAFF